jgi:hypothetical protein
MRSASVVKKLAFFRSEGPEIVRLGRIPGGHGIRQLSS